MSDEETKQEEIQGKMAAINGRIKTTAIFFIIGWALLMFSVMAGQAHSIIALLAFLSLIIMPWPMLGRMLKGGFGAMFNMPVYYTVTTYSDGSKTDDYALSAGINLGLKAILLAIGVAIGFIASAVYLIFLILRYLHLYTQAKPKPAFIKTAFFILVVTVVGFIPASIIPIKIGEGILISKRNADRAAFMSKHGDFIKAIENADKQPITAYAVGSYRQMTIWDFNQDPPVWVKDKWLSEGDTVTIIAPYEGSVRVRHEDDVGTMSPENLSLTPPVKTD
jgi:hypothetical protein